MDNKAKAAAIVAIGMGFLGLLAFLVIIGPFITMWAWSHFMVPVFGLKTLTWTQAFALGLLGSCFGKTSFGSGK